MSTKALKVLVSYTTVMDTCILRPSFGWVLCFRHPAFAEKTHSGEITQVSAGNGLWVDHLGMG